MSLRLKLKNYYLLTKPGIIYGNAITTIGGFLLASKTHFNFFLFIAALLGISLVIASSCVINNYLDRSLDVKMKRTQKRGLVTGSVPVINAIIYAVILGILGFAILIFHTNLIAAITAFVGYFFYLVMYSYFKRKSIHGTIVGSISGAVPPVVGYTAVSNQLDLGAIILFLILVVWQMPHFYAIAIFRKEDYTAAKLPILSVVKGIKETKIQILIYIIIFTAVSSLLTIFRYTGFTYLTVMTLFSLIWLGIGLKGFNTKDENKWARKMFGFSLLIITVFSLTISLNSFLP